MRRKREEALERDKYGEAGDSARNSGGDGGTRSNEDDEVDGLDPSELMAEVLPTAASKVESEKGESRGRE